MNTKNWLKFTLPFLGLGLSACTTMPQSSAIPLKPAQNQEAQYRDFQQPLSSLTQWQAQGVIGVRIDNQGQSANYEWRQNNHDYTLQVYGPLGIGNTTFVGTANEVTMTDSKGEKFSAPSAEALMQQALGWFVPIEGLYYWARGLPMPNQPYDYTLNEYGTLATLEQSGWLIRYQNYQLYDGKYPLASRIRMQQNNLNITAVIRSWYLNP